MGLLHVLRGKLVVALIAGFTLVGGGAAVLAATPAGQQTLHAITGSAHPTATPQATDHSNQNQHPSCVGLADAQHMAAQFSLSSASDSDALQAICALHAGTFKGTTPGGSAISSSRVFGYGEIEQLLTYAKYLANQGGKLTTQNARSYLAAALQSCRTTPLEPCLKAHIPGYHPGNDTGNGNGNGKPEGTPTPHH
ncbi:MAG TPA: hypothetical protein VKT82_12000 [Ktedonobacterales bacterium]|nr:hypothetical protein [Ktedonobacterales bacterium]